MNCIITIKIIDFLPKVNSIPYENYKCIFFNDDFTENIYLNKSSNKIFIQETPKINSDIKYTIHILESKSNSLIGISELIIPLIELKKSKPPCTIKKEQKIKIIIDINTKRKLFKTLINSTDMFFLIKTEIFIPDAKLLAGGSKIEVKKQNLNSDNKSKKLTKDIINKNKRKKLENEIKKSFMKIDEINLSNKRTKISKLNNKRSPKKRISILELMEQKMKPLLLNTNEDNISSQNNDNQNSLIAKPDKRISINLDKKNKKFISQKSLDSSKKQRKNIINNNSTKKGRSSKYLTQKISQESGDLVPQLNMNNLKQDKVNISVNINKTKIPYDNKLRNISNDHSYFENDDIYSNNGILSTEERTEFGLSESDKIILEKSTELRDIFQEQLKHSNNYKKFSGTLYMTEKNKINENLGSKNKNLFIKKPSYDNIYNNNSKVISQNDIKNNLLSLLDLYHLLSQKMNKIYSENDISFQKLKLIKEEYKSENKIFSRLKQPKNKIDFISFLYNYINYNLNSKLFLSMLHIKNLESNIYQNIFNFSLDDMEITRQQEIERVNKLNEERILNLLLKLIKSNINNMGKISKIYQFEPDKQNFLQKIMEKNGIKEDEINIGLEMGKYPNKMNIGNTINKLKFCWEENFENKIIKEEDEDKEEDKSEFNSSNKNEKNELNKENLINNEKKEIIKEALINKLEENFNNINNDKIELNCSNDGIKDKDNIINKKDFIYTKKVTPKLCQHHKRRRKKRIDDESNDKIN